MADQYNQTPQRRNHYLISMAVVGIVALLGGLIWVAVAYRMSSATDTSPVVLLGITLGSWLSGFGLVLLVIAWTIAAARHK